MGLVKSQWLILIPLIAIFFLALAFRTWQLDKYPVHLTMDEAEIGYNAYSILKTGRDTWNQFLPLAFRSANDYKPPVDIYITAGSIALLGLTELAVRLPVAIFGSLSVVIFILILRQLKLSWKSSLLTGVWFAILPWHINFSRSSFEAITALFFLLLGTLALLHWLNTQRVAGLFISVISLSLSIWTYHSERLFVPLFILFLIILFRKRFLALVKQPKLLTSLIIIILIFGLPFIALTFFTPAITARAKMTSMLADPSLINSLHHGHYTNITSAIFDNDLFVILRVWFSKYINYFDIRFWFTKGLSFTPPGLPDLGLLYLVDLPIFVLGFYALVTSKNKLLKQFALFWLLAGPLAASVTINDQHPLRALTFLPFFGFVFASSIEFLTTNVKRFIKPLAVIYLLLLLINVAFFIDIYTIQYPKQYSEYFQYGYKDISLFACQHKNDYKKIIITDVFGSLGPLNTGLPPSFFLFYCHYDPQTFLNDKRTVPGIEFGRPNYSLESKNSNYLLIGSPWDFPPYTIPQDQVIPEKNIIKRLYFLNGKPAFVFVKTD